MVHTRFGHDDQFSPQYLLHGANEDHFHPTQLHQQDILWGKHGTSWDPSR